MSDTFTESIYLAFLPLRSLSGGKGGIEERKRGENPIIFS